MSKSSNSVRLIDIANKAGVSRSTVAKVLLGSGGENVRVSSKTIKLIRRIGKELNYSPNVAARQLKGMQSHVIGVLVDSYAPQIFLECMAEMERRAASHGYRFMVGQSHGEIERIRGYANDFFANGVDGIICISHDYPDIGQNISRIYSGHTNVIFIGKPREENSNVSYIETDIAEGSVMAVKYLFQKNKRRVALVMSGEKYSSIRDRKIGYVRAHHEIGIALDERLVILMNDQGKVTPEIVYNSVSKAILEFNADAIFAQDDIVAIHAIKQCKKLGKTVPGDISVVGFDNTMIASLYEPNLTTIDQNISEVSRLAVDMLISIIEGKTEETCKIINIKPQLIIRESA